MTATTLAVVDLGSNSFRLEIGRVEGDQIYRQDTWRENLRFGAGLDDRGRITPTSMRAAIACLARFRERLSGVHPSAIRAVATNVFRVAINAREFLPHAERALGCPIDVISGHEEARLIYAGVARVLPLSDARRLVVDIGGGSTEFIIGRGLVPERLESLKLGCVSVTERFFPDGKVTAAAFNAAETAARVEIEAIAKEFGAHHWQDGYASSGTAAALAEILEQNGFSSGGITPTGLERLRKRMLLARQISRLKLNALKPERVPVLAGGLAIMMAAVAELRVEHLAPVGGALRLGVLYDLLGRTIDKDVRQLTVDSFAERYHLDRAHAARVAALATSLFRQAATKPSTADVQILQWAALLHEAGMSVSHTGFHQARRLYRAARRHAGFFRRRPDAPGDIDLQLSRTAGEDGTGVDRSHPSRPDCRLAVGGTVLSRAHGDRVAASDTRHRPAGRFQRQRALARQAPIDGAPAFAGACPVALAGSRVAKVGIRRASARLVDRVRQNRARGRP